jgi:hypothetical protein
MAAVVAHHCCHRLIVCVLLAPAPTLAAVAALAISERHRHYLAVISLRGAQVGEAIAQKSEGRRWSTAYRG